MDLIILPGNSPGNKLWSEEVRVKFAQIFKRVSIVEYKSWLTNDYQKVIDLDLEVNKVKELASNMSDYCVFAKSVGTALSMKAVSEKVINPQKCMFVGIPLDWLATNNIPINNWVKDYHIPTMVVQQRNDPFGNAETAGDFLSTIDSVTNYSIIEGNDHKYGDVVQVISKTKSFLLGK